MSRYRNVTLEVGAHRYRVAFFMPLRRVMIVCRKTARGETAINYDGPTGRLVSGYARLMLNFGAA